MAHTIASADREIAAVAARQHGHVTRRQLLDAGLSRDQIGRRLRAGNLIRAHAGVYAVGHRPAGPVAGAAAAVLACGPVAALSHGSAAALWGFGGSWPRTPEVSVATHRCRPGIAIHRTGTLRRRDVTRQRGVRVTTPARTLLDIAGRLPARRLVRAVNDALVAGYLHDGDLAEIVERFPAHPGARRLMPFTDRRGGPTRYVLEDAFLSFIERFDLPRPQTNVLVGGYLVDAYFPEQQLIVELDGYHYHRDRAAFERDRERDAAGLEDGRRTLRLTDERLTGQPVREAQRLRRILAG